MGLVDFWNSVTLCFPYNLSSLLASQKYEDADYLGFFLIVSIGVTFSCSFNIPRELLLDTHTLRQISSRFSWVFCSLAL